MKPLRFDTPPVGAILKCLICDGFKPWGLFDGATGVSICTECKNAANAVSSYRDDRQTNRKQGLAIEMSVTDEQGKKFAERNTHIPTNEIERDIADTRREVEQMEREVEGYRLIGDKMSLFRADARLSGIKQRQEFIEKLEAILQVRERPR